MWRLTAAICGAALLFSAGAAVGYVSSSSSYESAFSSVQTATNQPGSFDQRQKELNAQERIRFNRIDAKLTELEAVLYSLTFNPPQALGATFGVYRGYGNLAGVQTFEAWVPRPVDVVLEFLPGSDVSDPINQMNSWGTSRKLVWSVPLPDGGSVATCASGGYNSLWTTLAERLVAGGHGADIIRPLWEFNSSWFSWSTNGTQAGNDNLIACFQQIVTSMRTASGQQFRFDWNQDNNNVYDPYPAYPGDSYVDIVGNDAYDCASTATNTNAERWASIKSRLDLQTAFAVAHNKTVSFPEWGVWDASRASTCGVDNPDYINKMADHFEALGARLEYQTYFEFNATDGRHRLSNTTTDFPNAAVAYRQRFGQ